MMTMGQTDLQVATRLPPARGQFAAWDWRSFYNAILHVMQNPTSQAAYYAAYNAITRLPPSMRMTPQVLTAGWARFTQLYPGWKKWDYRSAYEMMFMFLRNTGRLLKGDDRQWWTVERGWQAMEVPELHFIARPTPSMGRRY